MSKEVFRIFAIAGLITVGTLTTTHMLSTALAQAPLAEENTSDAMNQTSSQDAETKQIQDTLEWINNTPMTEESAQSFLSQVPSMQGELDAMAAKLDPTAPNYETSVKNLEIQQNGLDQLKEKAEQLIRNPQQ